MVINFNIKIFSSIDKSQCTALYDFVGNSTNELSFKVANEVLNKTLTYI